MNRVEIEAESDGSVFAVEIDGGAISVFAQDDADANMARLASLRIHSAMRDGYTPALGEPLAYAASVAANVLGGTLKTQIPSGEGELEQATSGSQSRTSRGCVEGKRRLGRNHG
jgi:hypothetical protein